jgi:hypothetical protein
VQYLPYDDAEKARQQYKDEFLNKGKRKQGRDMFGREVVTTLDPPLQNPSPYEDLNE